MDPTKATDNLWRQQSGVIRRFLELRPRYEKLSEETAYILEKCVRAERIEYSAITHRAKTLDSFCEKVQRKAYENPPRDITDLAGVRIVYLYVSDRPKLEDTIEKEFTVVEKADKIENDDSERFGYGALHYLVKLGRKSSGARYDDLKDLLCEIQVRTILQDAWAVVAHHLSYKQESDVPLRLRRKLNALSGLFETADDQFDRLRAERTQYTKNIIKEIESRKDTSLRRDLNMDNLIAFLNWRLPDRGETTKEDAVVLLSDLQQLGCQTLADVEHALSRTESAVKAYETKYPPTNIKTNKTGPYAPMGVVRVAFEFIDAEYRKRLSSETFRNRLAEFDHLVEPKKKARA